MAKSINVGNAVKGSSSRKPSRCYPAPSTLELRIPKHYLETEEGKARAVEVVMGSYARELTDDVARDQARFYITQFVNGDLFALLPLSDLLKEHSGDQASDDPMTLANTCISHVANSVRKALEESRAAGARAICRRFSEGYGTPGPLMNLEMIHEYLSRAKRD
jgi:hypothetical protein